MTRAVVFFVARWGDVWRRHGFFIPSSGNADADEGSAGWLIDYYADMCVEGATARSDNDWSYVHLVGGEIR